VATNTLRVAKNAFEFLPLAEEALGFPIEIIAGREEARLIYIGASHSLPSAAHKRLVIDIGGGSTEFIIGKRHEPQLMESLYMGCVTYTLRFFPDRRIDRKRLREAQVAAAKEIELIAHDYQRLGWKEAVGSSGSARAIADVLELNGMNPNGESGITRVGLDKLCALLIKAGSAEALDLPGIKGDRLPVFPGGVAIMSAIFEELDIERMSYADGALRLGVLYDLLGRFHHHDMRDSTVAQFRRRYQVEGDQVERVEATAISALTQLAEGRRRKLMYSFFPGLVACMKSVFRWRTTLITSMGLIFWLMQTCQGFPGKIRGAWRCWCSVIAANLKSWGPWRQQIARGI
jgi:exopolyphosphatase/guanosine-5'-triphosphate,3'-diphosphate pyrophosphatase